MSKNSLLEIYRLQYFLKSIGAQRLAQIAVKFQIEESFLLAFKRLCG